MEIYTTLLTGSIQVAPLKNLQVPKTKLKNSHSTQCNYEHWIVFPMIVTTLKVNH